MIRVKSMTKGFLAILLATVIPTLIMFIIFASVFDPSITGVWATMIVAGAAMLMYGIFVSLVGVRKYMRKR